MLRGYFTLQCAAVACTTERRNKYAKLAHRAHQVAPSTTSYVVQCTWTHHEGQLGTDDWLVNQSFAKYFARRLLRVSCIWTVAVPQKC